MQDLRNGKNMEVSSSLSKNTANIFLLLPKINFVS